MTVKAKQAATKPVGGEAGKKVLTVALGAMETAGKRITKLAKEGKKKLEHKVS